MKECLNCGKEISNRNKYCNVKCQKDLEYKQFIQRWKNGLEKGLSGTYAISGHIRRYLFEKYHNHCANCGWGEINSFTNNVPLESHHIDGDYQNNTEENLTLLCPNCHALTETYKNGNKGKGRKEREQYQL